MVVNSFSKYFSMTGWRIGWLVLPEDLVRPVECLAQNLFISAPHISQMAAEAAFDCHPELQANVAATAARAIICWSICRRRASPGCSPAEGAFYLYADISERTNDSVAFCARMLAEAGVAATPGVDFDRTRGNRFLRFSYCGPEADMAEAAARLHRWRWYASWRGDLPKSATSTATIAPVMFLALAVLNTLHQCYRVQFAEPLTDNEAEFAGEAHPFEAMPRELGSSTAARQALSAANQRQDGALLANPRRQLIEGTTSDNPGHFATQLAHTSSIATS